MSRLPADAFSQYLALGPERSYEALARRLGVTKRTISRVATKERWQERIAKIEQQARERTDEKAAESIEAINTRHLQILRAIQSKALQGLAAVRLDNAMDCVRALDLAIRQERVVLGEPGERNAVSFEEVARKEFERWMKPADDEGGEDDDASTEAAT
jgi:transposase-like protein